MALEDLIVRNTRQWLTHASDDLELAENAAREATRPFLRDAAFHSQQSAEKAWKAFLTWHDVPFPRIHDLEDIGARCVRADTSLQTVADTAAQLSQYAWRFRYPGEPYEPTAEEVRRALQLAHETFEAVLSRLPAEVQP
jgi:HEPN domain-containing protein